MNLMSSDAQKVGAVVTTLTATCGLLIFIIHFDFCLKKIDF